MIGTTLLSVLLLATAGAGAEPPPSPLALEAVLVTPEKPAADTLCRLTVKVANRSDRTVTALAFTVTLGDHELPVYRTQLYLQAFPPGTTTELHLYNFWTSETVRPAPTNGVLPVKVTLREAKYVTITRAENGDETWQLGEAVGGLPVAAEKVVRLGKK